MTVEFFKNSERSRLSSAWLPITMIQDLGKAFKNDGPKVYYVFTFKLFSAVMQSPENTANTFLTNLSPFDMFSAETAYCDSLTRKNINDLRSR